MFYFKAIYLIPVFCLQNIQQAVEKFLKALLIEKAIGLARSHSIRHLVNVLSNHNVTVAISEDDIDLIDSVYMPSRYPVVSVLPDFIPDRSICEKCLRVASEVKNSVILILENS